MYLESAPRLVSRVFESMGMTELATVLIPAIALVLTAGGLVVGFQRANRQEIKSSLDRTQEEMRSSISRAHERIDDLTVRVQDNTVQLAGQEEHLRMIESYVKEIKEMLSERPWCPYISKECTKK